MIAFMPMCTGMATSGLVISESADVARGKLMGKEDTTGGKVWDSGRVLAELLSTQYREQLPNMKVLELGSGTGIGGLTAAAAGASVTLTDGSLGVIPLLEANVRVNELQERVSISRLRWGFNTDLLTAVGDQPDLVIGSDLLYSPDTFSDLLDTLEDLCTPDHTEVLVCSFLTKAAHVHPLMQRAVLRWPGRQCSPPMNALPTFALSSRLSIHDLSSAFRRATRRTFSLKWPSRVASKPALSVSTSRVFSRQHFVCLRHDFLFLCATRDSAVTLL